MRRKQLDYKSGACRILIAAMTLMIFGCAKPTSMRLTDEHYAKKDRWEEVDLYLGSYDGDYQAIAVIEGCSEMMIAVCSGPVSERPAKTSSGDPVMPIKPSNDAGHRRP